MAHEPSWETQNPRLRESDSSAPDLLAVLDKSMQLIFPLLFKQIRYRTSCSGIALPTELSQPLENP